MVTGILVTPVVIVSSAWLAQAWWLPTLILARLEKATGLELTADSLIMGLDGSFVASGVQVRERGAPGRAGRLLATVGRAEAILGWGRLLRDQPATGITLAHPVFRVRVSDLTPPTGDPAEGSEMGRRFVGERVGISILPDIEIHDGRIELIEITPAGETLFLAAQGVASLHRRAVDSDVYDFSLQQLGAGSPLEFSGRLDLRSREAHFQTGDIEFTNWLDLFEIRDAETWRSILTSGRLVTATIDYSPADGLRTTMVADQVRLSAPLPKNSDALDATGVFAEEGAQAGGPAEPPLAPDARSGEERLLFDKVTGEVTLAGPSLRAKLVGLIDGLPTSVDLTSAALSPSAPFHIEIRGGPYLIDQAWKPLAFTPAYVRAFIRDFSAPQAQILARIDLSRVESADSRDSADDIFSGVSVGGEVQVRHGAAMFVEFPYPIHEIAGVVRFDDSTIRLEEFTGMGLSGARIEADGVVNSSNLGVGLEIAVHAREAPIDSFLLDSLKPQQRDVVASLFDQESMSKLQERGVLATTPQKAEAQKANRHEVLQRPTFDLKGLTRFDARLHRAPGSDEELHIDADIYADRLGVVFDEFPYPVSIGPLHLFADEAGVRIDPAPIVGLTGAEGWIAGEIRTDELGAAPEVELHLTSAPVDQTLLAALRLVEENQEIHTPTPVEASSATGARPATVPTTAAAAAAGSELMMHDILRRLGIGGVVGADVSITTDAAGEIVWRVETPLAGATLAPRADGRPSLSMNEFSGALSVDNDGWRIRDGTGAAGASIINFGITSLFDEDQSTRMTFSSPSFDLGIRIEELIRAIGSDAADSFAEQRDRHAISGVVAMSGEANISRLRSDRRIAVAPAGPLAILIDGKHVRFAPRSGRLIVQNDMITLDDVELELLDEGGTADGTIRLSDEALWQAGTSAPLADGVPRDSAASSPGAIRADLSNLAMESPFVQAAMRSIDPRLNDWADAIDLTGRLDGSLTFDRTAGEVSGFQISDGEIRPQSLRFQRNGRRVAIDDIRGDITLNPTGGEFRELSVRSDDWNAALSGRWFGGTTPGLEVDLMLSGSRLSGSVFGLLPEPVIEVAWMIGLEMDGPFELRDAHFAFNAPVGGVDLGDGFRDGVGFEGRMSFRGARIGLGAPITNIDGDMRIRMNRPPFAADSTFELDVQFDRFFVAGILAQDGQVTIRSSSEADSAWRIMGIATSHGGRMWGDGTIQIGDFKGPRFDGHGSGIGSAPDNMGRYEFDLRLSGLDLAGALSDLSSESSAAQPAGQRGRVDASLTIGGEVGKPNWPRGSGALRIAGGELAKLPLAMSVLELGNIIPPIGERLDYASAELTLANGVIRLGRVLAVSPSLALVGDGSMRLDDGTLDLRFGASTNSRLPVFSSIFDLLRNELLTTRVRGTIAHPELSVQQLGGTRRFLGRLLGFGGGSARTPAGETASESSP